MNHGNRLLSSVAKRGYLTVRRSHRRFYSHGRSKNTESSIDILPGVVCGGLVMLGSSSCRMDEKEKLKLNLDSGTVNCEQYPSEICEESERFEQTLRYHQRHLNMYRGKWDWKENPKSRIPTSSWPFDVPTSEDAGMLQSEMKYCNQSPNFRSDKEYCDTIRFRVASYILPNEETAEEALAILKDLAERGHPDGMCLYATCLNEGRAGLDVNPKLAVSYWKLAHDMYEHVQSTYELGVAFYTGEGVPEDEAEAVNMFRNAAEVGHSGAAYLLGDCLLDGIGAERDRAEALEWLIIAAELGHRGARSRVLAVLSKQEGVDYGRFTDASRQTFAVTTQEQELKQPVTNIQKAKTQPARPLLYERRFTIGGGARNPVVLARRQTIVTESRQK